MRLLLDTPSLIFAGQDNLPEPAKEAFLDAGNDIYFCLVSLWEIGIKAALGKLKFKRKLSEYHDMLIEELVLYPLVIEATHIEKAVGLPSHHRDPFDRLLIGQALVENLQILGSDAQFERYGCTRIWD